MKFDKSLLGRTADKPLNPTLVDASVLRDMIAHEAAFLGCASNQHSMSVDPDDHPGARTVDLTWTFRPAEIVGRVTEDLARRMVQRRLHGEGPYTALCRTEHTGRWRPAAYAMAVDTDTAPTRSDDTVQSAGWWQGLYLHGAPLITTWTHEQIIRLVVRVVDIAHAEPIDYTGANKPALPPHPEPWTIGQVEAVVRYALATYRVVTGQPTVDVVLYLATIVERRTSPFDVTRFEIGRQSGIGGVAIADVERVGDQMIVKAVPLS